MGSFIGTDAAVEQPFERRVDPVRGVTVVRKWRGSQSAIEAQESICSSAGYSTAVRQGPVWELEASIGLDIINGGGETPITTWELSGASVEKDLLSADTPETNGLHANDLKRLRDIFDGKVNVADVPEDLTTYFEYPFWGDPIGLFTAWSAGVKSKLQFAPVLRLNQSASRSYTVPTSLLYVGQVISTDVLLGYVNVPASIANNLPEETGYVNRPGFSTTDLFYGWLVHHPTITTAAYNKVTISIEWHWGIWSTVLYEIVEA